MRLSDDYTIYPEGMEKLRKSGIEAKVQKIKNSRDGLGYQGGVTFEHDIVGAFNSLKERGYYKNIPADFSQHYKKVTNGMLTDSKKFNWTIQRQSGKVSEPCELGDLMLFLGQYPSWILGNRQMWDYAKFGFSNPTELIGLVSAYIIEQSRSFESEIHRTYNWTNNRRDGSEIVSVITGDLNCDLRIFQTDIAPYLTTDPFGNKTLFRPQLGYDRHIVSPFHSTEPALFLAAMKYVEQQQIQNQIPFWGKNARELFKWASSLGRGPVTCTEQFGGFDHHPQFFFADYDIPIPVLDENNKTTARSPYGLISDTDGAYQVFISHKGNLVLSYSQNEDFKNPVKRIDAEFLPEDAEHVLKGLIYQSAACQGRTSPEQLLSIFAYRFTPEFEEQRERFRNLIKKL